MFANIPDTANPISEGFMVGTAAATNGDVLMPSDLRIATAEIGLMSSRFL